MVTIPVTLDASRALTLRYTRSYYSVSLSVSPSGAGYITPGEQHYPAGASVTLTAVPSSGYQFSSWSGDVTGTANPVTFTMPARDISVVANFTAIPPPETCLLSIRIYPSGSGSVTPPSGYYPKGSTINMLATPASGYRFDSWSGDFAIFGSVPQVTFTLTKDMAGYANFAAVPPGTATFDIWVRDYDTGALLPIGYVTFDGERKAIPLFPIPGLVKFPDKRVDIEHTIVAESPGYVMLTHKWRPGESTTVTMRLRRA